jgi:hypothetical protein
MGLKNAMVLIFLHQPAILVLSPSITIDQEVPKWLIKRH